MSGPSISLDPEAGALILRYRLASISQEQLWARQKPSANNRRLLPSTRAGLARSSHDGLCGDRASATCAPALAQQSDSRALPRTSPKLHRNARAGRDRPGNKKPARQRVIEGASAGRGVLWGTSGSPEDAGGRGAGGHHGWCWWVVAVQMAAEGAGLGPRNYVLIPTSNQLHLNQKSQLTTTGHEFSVGRGRKLVFLTSER